MICDSFSGANLFFSLFFRRMTKVWWPPTVPPPWSSQTSSTASRAKRVPSSPASSTSYQAAPPQPGRRAWSLTQVGRKYLHIISLYSTFIFQEILRFGRLRCPLSILSPKTLEKVFSQIWINLLALTNLSSASGRLFVTPYQIMSE